MENIFANLDNVLIREATYQCFDHSFSGLSESFQIAEHVVTIFLFGQFQIGVDR